jgi:hypothetical protein
MAVIWNLKKKQGEEEYDEKATKERRCSLQNKFNPY